MPQYASQSPPPLEVWSWIRHLPSTRDDSWPDSDPTLELAGTRDVAKAQKDGSKKSILLKAERTRVPGGEAASAITFSVFLEGFSQEKPLWVSNPCSLVSKPFFPDLLLQLLQETISRAPTVSGSHNGYQIDARFFSRCFESISLSSDQYLSQVYNLAFLGRLFWLCVFDTPSEVGSLYFQLLSSNINSLSCNSAKKSTFLRSIGCDGELYLMRSLGYISSKWLILRELQSVPFRPPPSPPLGFSYAKSSHGLLILKAYTPVLSMDRTCYNEQQDPYARIEAKESLLKYALGHQQLEAVVQFEYAVSSFQDYVKVRLRVDNIRLHVNRLGFRHDEDGKGIEFMDERHFPSRARVWVGPESGSSLISLGRSTRDAEREIETQRSVKSSLEENSKKFPFVKSKTKTAAKTRVKNWRWDQDAEGSVCIFDAVLCDSFSGAEVVGSWKAGSSSGDQTSLRNGFRKRYSGASRAFTKKGGVVFAGDEYGEEVSWRLDKEMEGSVMKWRMGGKVWLTYWPNEFKTTYSETRCVEWCEDIEIPLLVSS
ncbi:hypothetical protein H6P81_020554 [Aristolochia fimbriata]|uniref:Uncharacterized protein n=1 Tax=Aristolochia fimbriata TaxID=158543 RepID=A0AAV7DV20_ARIFI|nr:hypothetical protein H6P81_020554 [Aristolochia fimbriata]